MSNGNSKQDLQHAHTSKNLQHVFTTYNIPSKHTNGYTSCTKHKLHPVNRAKTTTVINSTNYTNVTHKRLLQLNTANYTKLTQQRLLPSTNSTIKLHFVNTSQSTSSKQLFHGHIFYSISRLSTHLIPIIVY